MKPNQQKTIKVIITSLLLLWYGFFLIRPIDINHNDLGRHLANGREFLSFIENKQSPMPILNTNFYSFTHTNFPFINHHWGAGVIFFIVYSAFGFLGLHLFFIIISFATFLIFFTLATKKSNWLIASSLAFFLIPLIAFRNEVRPEIFSYLFLGIFFWILNSYKNNPTKNKQLFLLPIIMFFWINLHIYFIFGLFLLFYFFVGEIIYEKNFTQKARKMLFAFLLSILVGLLNPNHIKTIIYPFNIFKNYGIRVHENIGLFKITILKELDPSIMYTIIVSMIILLLFFAININKKLNKEDVFNTGIIIIFGLLAWLMIRNISLYSFFALPIISSIIYNGFKKNSFYFVMIFILSILFLNYKSLPDYWNNWNLRYSTTGEEAASFVKNNHIAGPLFNDYNTGGYTAFYFFPNIKLFIDNRPEAYPVSFLKDEYSSALNKEEIWTDLDNKYNFNLIFLDFKNRYISIDSFIKNRITDPNWIPIFKNDYHIIFIKRNEENVDIIQQFEIPAKDL